MRVVGALAAVDVVVGVDRAAVAQAPGREVGDDLVHVRVGRRAGAGLVDVDRELLVVVAVGDRGGRRRDGAGDVRWQQVQVAVRLRGGHLDQRQGTDEAAREALAGDREVEDGSLGRGAIQGVGRARPSRPSSRAPGGSRRSVRSYVRSYRGSPGCRSLEVLMVGTPPEPDGGVQRLRSIVRRVRVDLHGPSPQVGEPPHPVPEQGARQAAPLVGGVGPDRLELADLADRVPPGQGEGRERAVGRLHDEIVLEAVVRAGRQTLVLVEGQARRRERRSVDVDASLGLGRAGDVADRVARPARRAPRAPRRRDATATGTAGGRAVRSRGGGGSRWSGRRPPPPRCRSPRATSRWHPRGWPPARPRRAPAGRSRRTIRSRRRHATSRRPEPRRPSTAGGGRPGPPASWRRTTTRCQPAWRPRFASRTARRAT